MTPLERLRLAAALAHAVPGAELGLVTHRGERIVAGHHPGADIDPCKLRRVVAASACRQQPDVSQHLSEIVVGGSLIELSGGVFATRRSYVEQRWIASFLPSAAVSELLDDVGPAEIPADAMRACLKPDPQLGVTVVGLTSNDARFDHALDTVAAQAAARCFVAERLSEARSLAPTDDRIGGAL